MRPANLTMLTVAGLLAALISSSPVRANDPLNDAMRRVGYWHLHVRTSTINNGTTNIERDYDHCLDLRNPAPPVSKLAQWACPEFNVQKTQTALHSRAVCTFANNGHLVGRTDIELGRDKSSVNFHQEFSWNWTTPTGTSAQSHTVSTGRLTGDCPAGASVTALIPPSAAEDAIIRHNGH